MKSPRSDKSETKKKKVPKTVAVDLGSNDYIQKNKGDNTNPATVTEILSQMEESFLEIDPKDHEDLYFAMPKNRDALKRTTPDFSHSSVMQEIQQKTNMDPNQLQSLLQGLDLNDPNVSMILS